jgi:intraflagellar transport protein 88
MDNRAPPSSYNRGAIGTRSKMTTAMRQGTAQQRLGTAVRSNAAAGFPSQKKQFDPMSGGPAPALEKKSEKSEEENFKEMEEEVHRLLEQSAEAKTKTNVSESLAKAKEAATKEKKIRQIRESTGSLDQVNIDLTFYVFYNLANMYHANNLYQEALNSYMIILKNKQYPQASRLRVNMGNIYFEQGKFPLAIKMYNMALDSTAQTNKEMKLKIKRNIAIAYVKLGMFGRAIEVYEDVMNDTPDFDVGFNLILCIYALGDKVKMKTWFERMLMIDLPGAEEEETEEILQLQNRTDDKDKNDSMPANDPLKEYLKEKKKEALKFITNAAKLIAPVIEGDVMTGFDWIIEMLRTANLMEVESEIEIAKAIYFIKNKEIDKAIALFKSFEKKDKIMMARAANNISFLYFLENDFQNAEKFADMAIQHDRYNSKALVNKGNCLFINEDYDRSKEFFLEAIGVEADCVEAIYNLGLVYKRLGYYNEALQAFEKLHTIIPNSQDVIYQIGHINELIGMRRQALKWYSILVTKVPSDSEVLAKMGYLYQTEEDEFQALHYYMESYRYNPSKIDVISWLGIHHVKSEMYEKAVNFFERASQIQPREVKWKLMVASCFRRMNLYQQALKLYEEIIQEHPDNIECLRYLVSICKDLGLKYDHYSMELKKLERKQE